MKLTLFTSGQAGNQTTTVYPNRISVTDEQTLIQAVQFDHVAASYQNHTRSTATFLQSDVVVMNIDNDHSENPEEWVTAEMLEDLFDDYQFALATSRSHMLVKGRKLARPKYHIYFPIESISDAKTYVALKEELVNRYAFFDGNAKDAARFFFGHPQAEVIWHDSWLTIDDLLSNSFVEEEEDFDADFYTSPTGPIAQGSRNNTMSRFASRVLKKYGISQEARDAFDEEAQKCEPPLDKAELDTIWGSAVRFYNKTIKNSEGYIPPEEYNRGSLKPDDYSDIGEAGVLARIYGEKLAYTNATDYLTYTGKYWKEDKQLAVGSVVEFMDLQLEDATHQYETVIKQLVSTGLSENLIREGGKSLAKALETPQQHQLYSSYLATKAYYQFVMKRRDYRYIMATHNTAKPMLAIDLSELDKDELLLNTPDATFNLSKGMAGKQEHSATDYLTKVTTISPSDKG